MDVPADAATAWIPYNDGLDLSPLAVIELTHDFEVRCEHWRRVLKCKRVGTGVPACTNALTTSGWVVDKFLCAIVLNAGGDGLYKFVLAHELMHVALESHYQTENGVDWRDTRGLEVSVIDEFMADRYAAKWMQLSTIEARLDYLARRISSERKWVPTATLIANALGLVVGARMFHEADLWSLLEGCVGLHSSDRLRRWRDLLRAEIDGGQPLATVAQSVRVACVAELVKEDYPALSWEHATREAERQVDLLDAVNRR